MYEALKSFCKVIKGCETVELVRWMKRYWNTTISSLKTFIIGIKRDFQAVRNTIRLNITNGITEGFVNKLKVMKRSMYGKAELELLKNKHVIEHILFQLNCRRAKLLDILRVYILIPLKTLLFINR